MIVISLQDIPQISERNFAEFRFREMLREGGPKQAVFSPVSSRIPSDLTSNCKVIQPTDASWQ